MGLEHVTRLTCVRCGKHFAIGERLTCSSCGLEGILDVGYDEAKAARTLTRAALGGRACNHWRYRELLPIADDAPLPHLQVGMTPLYEAPRLAEHLGLRRLQLKDDGRNPTASFKDRASSMGVVKALEAKATAIACASTGNAASSLAGFSAAAGLKSFIFVPERAPEPKLAQLLIFGAHVLRVRGSYDDAWMFCQKACERYGWYNRNCAVNPYLVEGKKTVGLELAEEWGDDVPDWLVLSVGDGCTIAGAWKGVEQMHRLGFIPRLPRLLAVQAEGAAPVTEAFRSGKDLRPVETRTLADSIAVGHPRNWRKAVNAIRASRGECINVSDEAILEAMRRTARLAAVFAEPAASAAVAGLAEAVRQGVVGREQSATVVVTGNGLKDIKSAIQATHPPIDLPPDLDQLDSKLRERRLL